MLTNPTHVYSQAVSPRIGAGTSISLSEAECNLFAAALGKVLSMSIANSACYVSDLAQSLWQPACVLIESSKTSLAVVCVVCCMECLTKGI